MSDQGVTPPMADIDLAELLYTAVIVSSLSCPADSRVGP